MEGDPTASSFFAEVQASSTTWETPALTTLTFSIATIAGLLLLSRLAPRVPAPLIAVAAGIALVAFVALDDHGVALIAPVPSDLPSPHTPSFDHIGELLPWAIAIALMCFLETAAVAGERPPTRGTAD